MLVHTLRKDFLASIVVFLVAIPLCIGIAYASGFPASYGLISGIIGGIVVGMLGGCKLQASGPAAGLITVVWEIVNQFGVASFGAIIFLAGIFQILFSVLKIGQWFRAVSPALVQGMLAAIGIMIFSSQFHVMVDNKPSTSGITNIMNIPSALYKGVFPIDGVTHHLSALIGLITIITIIVWNYMPSKFKILPPPLMGIVVAVITTLYLKLPIDYIEVPSNIFIFEHILSLESLKNVLNHSAIVSALTVAIIASTESLLTATAIDQLSLSGESTNYNKELRAQGIGNMLAGVLGILPITGVIVRSAANAQAGATSKMSTILHGIWLLAFLCFFPQILELIPIPALAGVLVYTGFKLINVDQIKQLMQVGRAEITIYLITVVAVLFLNLLEGIIIGFVTASIRLLYNLSVFNIKRTEGQNSVDLEMTGSATFLNLPQLASALESIGPQKNVNIMMNRLYYFDHACMEFLLSWEQKHLATQGKVNFKYNPPANHVSVMKPRFKRLLRKFALKSKRQKF